MLDGCAVVMWYVLLVSKNYTLSIKHWGVTGQDGNLYSNDLLKKKVWVMILTGVIIFFDWDYF